MSPEVPPETEPFQIELRHHHLPVLEKQGFISWTTEPFRASRGPNFREAAVVLESLHSSASRIPDQLVYGCQRLEKERKTVSE